jgi:hypothetical protein
VSASAMVGGLLRAALQGAAAGALATTALNAATYGDMALRGRPPSSIPEETVRKSLAIIGLRVPGDEAAQRNRLAGLAALGGLATGSTLGAMLGALRTLGLRPGPLLGPLVAGGVAMAGANAPLVVLRLSDPRRWSADDWASDLIPHLVFGIVAHRALESFQRPPARAT